MLESVEAIAMLTWPCRRRRQRVHHRASPLSRHAHRRDSFGEPLSQPRAPVDAGCRVGDDGEDATVGELAVDELRPVSAVLYSCVANRWDTLTYGPLLSVVVGALDRVHLAAKLDLKFDFLYLLFHIL